jgi:hypothetical protein
MNSFVIWWTSQYECEEVESMNLQLPEYIDVEFRSRLGRNGRGRLWVPENIPVKGIEWDKSKPAARLCEKRAGIVLAKEHIKYVINLPGFCTDLELNFVNAT